MHLCMYGHKIILGKHSDLGISVSIANVFITFMSLLISHDNITDKLCMYKDHY